MAKKRNKRKTQTALPMGYSAGGVVVPRVITETKLVERLIPIANISIENSNDAILNSSNDAIQSIANSGNSASTVSDVGNPTIGPISGGSASVGDVAGGSVSVKDNTITSNIDASQRKLRIETNSRVPADQESTGDDYTDYVRVARDITDSGTTAGSSSSKASNSGAPDTGVGYQAEVHPTAFTKAASILSAIGVPSFISSLPASKAAALAPPAIAGLLTSGTANAVVPFLFGIKTAMANHYATKDMVMTEGQAAAANRMDEQRRIAEQLEEQDRGGGGHTNGSGAGRKSNGDNAGPAVIPLTDEQKQFLSEGMELLGHFTSGIASWYSDTRQAGYSPYDAIEMAAEARYRSSGGEGRLYLDANKQLIAEYIDENVEDTSFPDLATFERYINPGKQNP